MPPRRKPRFVSAEPVRWGLCVLALTAFVHTAGAEHFEGKYFAGDGDVEYLQLLEDAYRLYTPNVEWPSIAMLYMPRWNGFVEGPTWDAWWIQNSYGPSYCAMPFYVEPYVTWLQNSQDLWFNQMGDGHRRAPDEFVKVAGEAAAVPPDGNLCDAARPGWLFPKQGDGKVNIHDWPLGFDAAGLLLQSEMLLIGRDTEAIKHYLPLLERVANFIDSRRDPKNNLFLAGPAANLLAPSYAGYKRPDGTYDMAFLVEVSVTYIAALDRLIELEKMAGDEARVQLYTQRRELARQGLAAVTTPEGYFVRSLDPDGTQHGVYGAAQHGYFESTPNHDAIAFRVVNDAQAEKIYHKIASIHELRPYAFIIPNYPGYDDMYENPAGLWAFGYWTNGGHWSTCEARMVMAYYRLGRYDDARRSMQQLLPFVKRWRMDNNLTKFGSDVYQPNQPINIVYDTWSPAAGLIRGLFEYLYKADGLTLIPHIPPGITLLEQRFPIRLGENFFFLRIRGQGPITRVRVNGNDFADFDTQSVHVTDSLPEVSTVTIFRGGSENEATTQSTQNNIVAAAPSGDGKVPPPALRARYDALGRFARAVRNMGSANAYEVAHAELAMRYIELVAERREAVAQNRVPQLPAVSQAAADQRYADTATKLCDGLEAAIKFYEKSDQPRQREIYERWTKEQ